MDLGVPHILLTRMVRKEVCLVYSRPFPSHGLHSVIFRRDVHSIIIQTSSSQRGWVVLAHLYLVPLAYHCATAEGTGCALSEFSTSFTASLWPTGKSAAHHSGYRFYRLWTASALGSWMHHLLFPAQLLDTTGFAAHSAATTVHHCSLFSPFSLPPLFCSA